MRINTNMSAVKANSQLRKTGFALDKSLEKLTSGLKINRASDDAAGMAISQKMKTQIRGLERSSQNASDGISVIQTSEGALTEVEAMLQRMRELSVQAANGTNALDDKQAIQEEIDKLKLEIQRISDDTEFNKKRLLNGEIDRKSYSDTPDVKLISLSDDVDTTKYQIKITQDARQAVLTGDDIGLGINGTITAAEAGVININGEEVKIVEGDTRESIYKKLRDAGDIVNVKIFGNEKGANGKDPDLTETAGYKPIDIMDANANSLVFVSEEYGSKEEIKVYCDNPALATALGLTTKEASVKGIDAKAETVKTSDGFAATATVSSDGNQITVTDAGGFEVKFEIKDGTAKTTFTDAEITAPGASPSNPTITAGTAKDATITVLDAGPMTLQVGANEHQTMEVRIPAVTPKTLGIDKTNVCTGEGAQKSITAMSKAITEVSAIRSKLGAYQNRLEHAIANLDTTSENMTEALSRIEDTDMAEEMANYTQKSVLSQAGTSMLAQANQRPQNILTLLQS